MNKNDKNIEGNYLRCEGGPPTLTLDVELYQHYLDDSDLTDEEKREFLQALWSLICEFVYLGFGVNSVQQAMQDHCGQLGKKPIDRPKPSPDSVKLEFHNTQNIKTEEG